ncbi:MAG: hypothetical protein PHI12_13865 [Dehalococcoidales bacterium]|nr:hypothetical protein [Dehalococcoidales bacterium]
MAVTRIGSLENRFIGLSTDTKPTANTQNGGTFYEWNTGFMWLYNGYAWVPKSFMPGTTVNYKQISLNQAAAAYDVMTATAQNLFIDAVIVHVPDNLSAVDTFTGISVATDDDAPIEILSSTAGAKAKLTGNFFHVYRGPVVTASTKKIQLTIGGGSAGEGMVADVTVLWRPLVAGGYYLNA